MEFLTWNDADTKDVKIATLGFFDGFHSGHIKLMNLTINNAKKSNLKSLFFTFSERVEDFFKHTNNQIVDNQTKKEIVARFGFDYYLEVKTSLDFLNLSYHDFLTDLKQRYNITAVVVGNDFRFGHNKEGNVEHLKDFFGANNVIIVNRNDNNISSTKIRQLLQENNIALANKYLKEPYSIHGIVAHGQKIGRLIGFPTANLYVYKPLVINKGVYLTRTIYNAKCYESITCYFEKDNVYRIETYLLNFKGNLYGENLKVIFLSYLRDNVPIASLSQLEQLILSDLAAKIKKLRDNKKD